MLDLLCHPTTPCPAISSVAVELTPHNDNSLTLTWIVTGDIDRIVLPEPAPAVHTDELWQHTCFECFIREGDGPAYREFNLAPSGAWAAYRFDAYRAGMRPLELHEIPEIVLNQSGYHIALAATLPAEALPPNPQLAVSAVVLLADGSKTYWALKHAGGKPDFHHDDGFVLPLARVA